MTTEDSEDSEDDYRTGCRNVSHCQQQQSYSGLRSPGRWVQTFHKTKTINKPLGGGTVS